MMNAAVSALPVRTSVSAVIRRARPSDAAALTRLIARADVGGDAAVHAGAVRALFATGHLFVLDAALGELGAAAHVELGRDTGHLDHRHLLAEVWGPEAVARTHDLRVHMAALRRKIEADAAQPQWLLTETGVGYRLRAPF